MTDPRPKVIGYISRNQYGQIIRVWDQDGVIMPDHKAIAWLSERQINSEWQPVSSECDASFTLLEDAHSADDMHNASRTKDDEQSA